MKSCIVISDSFKGTLSSLEICRIAQETIPEIFPDCQVTAIPVADGGEGTVDCFLQTMQAIPVRITSTGPYGEEIECVYARSGTKAVVEMACAAGLPMVGERRNPELTTTYGVGTVIRHAVEHGCTEILLGLGGSATNDGGCGCAAALGGKFFNRNGEEFVPIGSNLDKIEHIDISGTKALLKNVRITVMCDVDNPLYGPEGAACVFAPQKGADGAMAARLDKNLRRLAVVIERELGISVARRPGAGAAGGMGAGCIAFLGAELKSGIEAILDLTEFDRNLERADLVITGEGRVDGQSLRGKVISGIARRTKPRNIPLIVIAGGIDPSADEAYGLGVTAMFGIDREAKAFEEYAQESSKYYRRTLKDILRCIRMAEQMCGFGVRLE